MRRYVELVIEDIAFGGRGVGRADGKAVFVPFTIDGERVTARITREKKSFAEAEIVRLEKSSPARVAPLCPYFGRCGGCSYQHMNYEHQLRWKERQVAQVLQRIGKFHEPPLQPIVASPLDYDYRNRITVHVDRGVVGFFRRDVHRLIDIEHCPISAAEVNIELSALRARRPRDGHYTLRAHAGPRVFSQTNDAVAEKLAEAIDALIPPDQTLLIDAYCGAGFFAKRLLGKFERVVGLDWDIHAIAAAEADALPSESYFAGDLAAQLASHLAAAEPSRTTVIVDPPATGLSVEVREILALHPVATVVYVSCNPPTLARDLADLSTGFTLGSVTPFDMFPQTAEIEALAHLTSK
ncbi:MAG TPA: TRAM domain-containing protein [Chthoniobacterales bacterium]|jgi:23S rRNA (uracil1939-C5)-methyltransferase